MARAPILPSLAAKAAWEKPSVTMTRGQWKVILEAAANYNKRVPREQGDGGECLRLIADAINEDIPPLAAHPLSEEQK